MQHVILMGNPREGFVVVGPFEDIEDARRYIETDPTKGENMWIVEMVPPASDEGEPED